jgi:hypothetical protein
MPWGVEHLAKVDRFAKGSRRASTKSAVRTRLSTSSRRSAPAGSARSDSTGRCNFGINDDALLDVLIGRGEPEGRLPFELPRSMPAVGAQDPSLPHDSVHPLYPIFYGRGY